jgi:hypothetical protein
MYLMYLNTGPLDLDNPTTGNEPRRTGARSLSEHIPRLTLPTPVVREQERKVGGWHDGLGGGAEHGTRHGCPLGSVSAGMMIDKGTGGHGTMRVESESQVFPSFSQRPQAQDTHGVMSRCGVFGS